MKAINVLMTALELLLVY